MEKLDRMAEDFKDGIERAIKEKRIERDEAQDESEWRKDRLIVKIEAKFAQDARRAELFAVRRRLA